MKPIGLYDELKGTFSEIRIFFSRYEGMASRNNRAISFVGRRVGNVDLDDYVSGSTDNGNQASGYRNGARTHHRTAELVDRLRTCKDGTGKSSFVDLNRAGTWTSNVYFDRAIGLDRSRMNSGNASIRFKRIFAVQLNVNIAWYGGLEYGQCTGWARRVGESGTRQESAQKKPTDHADITVSSCRYCLLRVTDQCRAH